MNARRRSHLINLNRGLICALSLGGMVLDGLHVADLLCALALCLWLWLPLCTRLEAQLLQRVERKRGWRRAGRASPSL
ncbi:MAG: hypothetical protein LJE91_14920 [Gammaproteobacteria bacterium]|jgi:hypothetical protein|nr:hypothetical protein [Gammaproteobacteria bacterium]